MKKLSDFMDEAIQRKWVRNDAEIAMKVGVAQATVSRWRDGSRTPEDEEAYYLAEALMADPDELMPCCRAQKTKDPEARAVWERIAQRAGMAASLAGSVVVTLLATPSPAQAAKVLEITARAMCIM